MGRSRCPATALPNLTARTQWPSFYSKADGVVFVMDCRNVERFPEVNDALMVSRTAKPPCLPQLLRSGAPAL